MNKYLTKILSGKTLSTIKQKGGELLSDKSPIKRIIKKDGLIVVISFHSLEDGIVKDFFKPKIKSFPKDIPLNSQEIKDFKCIAKKVKASSKEVTENPRSRSAIMRVFQKI